MKIQAPSRQIEVALSYLWRGREGVRLWVGGGKGFVCLVFKARFLYDFLEPLLELAL